MSKLSHIQENTEKRNKNHQATGSLVRTTHITLETTAHIGAVMIIQTQKPTVRRTDDTEENTKHIKTYSKKALDHQKEQFI